MSDKHSLKSQSKMSSSSIHFNFSVHELLIILTVKLPLFQPGVLRSPGRPDESVSFVCAALEPPCVYPQYSRGIANRSQTIPDIRWTSLLCNKSQL